MAIAVGTEKEGLSAIWLAQATAQVRLPMLGQVNSLNVATAAALLVLVANGTIHGRHAAQGPKIP